jgi:hypothetical protein
MERRSVDLSRLVARCAITGSLARDALLRRFETFAARANDHEQIALLVRLDPLSAVNRLERRRVTRRMPWCASTTA